MKVDKACAIVFLLAFSSCFYSCSSGGGNDENPPVEPPTNQVNLPAKAVGVLPANGEPCSEYEVVFGDNSKVQVTFQWNEAEFAQSYILIVLESGLEIFRDSFTSLQTQVELNKGLTYTWHLISVNDEGDTNGDTFSFTTPGTPIGNFAPYAADITFVFNTDTLELDISWVGSDEDGDTLTYDVTVRENEEILVKNTAYMEDFLDTITYMAGTDYSVEVIAKDSSGNFSISMANEKAPD